MGDEADERARRREERRRKRDAEKGDEAEANGTAEETQVNAADEEAERQRQEEERKREEEERKQAEEQQRRDDEEEKKKKEAKAAPAPAAKKMGGGFGMKMGRKMNIKGLMMKKAQDDLKKETEQHEVEKKKFIEGQLGNIDNVEFMDKDELGELVKQIHEKLTKFESERYDLELIIKKNDLQIDELNSRVNEARGKFTRPQLKKVSRADKFAGVVPTEDKKTIDVQLKRVERKSASGVDDDKVEKVDLRAGLQKVEK